MYIYIYIYMYTVDGSEDEGQRGGDGREEAQEWRPARGAPGHPRIILIIVTQGWS